MFKLNPKAVADKYERRRANCEEVFGEPHSKGQILEKNCKPVSNLAMISLTSD